MVFRKLKEYAIDCCTSLTPAQGGYGLGYTENYCKQRQLAYWAFIDRRIYEDYPNRPAIEVLEEWLDEAYNPSNQQNLNGAKYLCLGSGFEDDDSPSFAIANPPDADGHTEAQLMGPMKERAQDQTDGRYEADFFLYTYQSPCGSPFPENCQKKIFQFTYDYIYPFHTGTSFAQYHSLAVGFEKWYRPGGTTIKNARTKFCKSVTDTKNAVVNGYDYRNVDFYPGLFLKKVTNEMDADGKGDDTYNPGVVNGVNRC